MLASPTTLNNHPDNNWLHYSNTLYSVFAGESASLRNRPLKLLVCRQLISTQSSTADFIEAVWTKFPSDNCNPLCR
jgi:hypothetical protein